MSCRSVVITPRSATTTVAMAAAIQAPSPSRVSRDASANAMSATSIPSSPTTINGRRVSAPARDRCFAAIAPLTDMPSAIARSSAPAMPMRAATRPAVRIAFDITRERGAEQEKIEGRGSDDEKRPHELDVFVDDIAKGERGVGEEHGTLNEHEMRVREAKTSRTVTTAVWSLHGEPRLSRRSAMYASRVNRRTIASVLVAAMLPVSVHAQGQSAPAMSNETATPPSSATRMMLPAGTSASDWTIPGHDFGGTRYSELDKIDDE